MILADTRHRLTRDDAHLAARLQVDGLRRDRAQRIEAVGNHERVRLAVFRLLEVTEQALFLEQPVHEIPVGFVLDAE